MTVAELINILKKFPKDLPVAYGLYSEQVLLQSDKVRVAELSKPRPDGWIHDARPDKPTQKYVLFPGN